MAHSDTDRVLSLELLLASGNVHWSKETFLETLSLTIERDSLSGWLFRAALCRVQFGVVVVASCSVNSR